MWHLYSILFFLAFINNSLFAADHGRPITINFLLDGPQATVKINVKRRYISLRTFKNKIFSAAKKNINFAGENITIFYDGKKLDTEDKLNEVLNQRHLDGQFWLHFIRIDHSNITI